MFKILILISILINALIGQDVTTETAQIQHKVDNVLVHFMDFKRSDFTDDFVKNLKTVIANHLTKYCTENQLICSIFTNNITIDNIDFIGTSMKEKFREDTRFVISNLYAKAVDRDGTENYLPKDTIEDFMTKARNEISSEANAPIAYLNNKNVYPKRNNLDNYIIISISSVFVVALVIFNLVCQIKTTKDMDSALKKKKPIYKIKETDENDEFADSTYQPTEQRFPVNTTVSENYPMINRVKHESAV